MAAGAVLAEVGVGVAVTGDGVPDEFPVGTAAVCADNPAFRAMVWPRNTVVAKAVAAIDPTVTSVVTVATTRLPRIRVLITPPEGTPTIADEQSRAARICLTFENLQRNSDAAWMSAE
jgi:hypothetical protein